MLGRGFRFDCTRHEMYSTEIHFSIDDSSGCHLTQSYDCAEFHKLIYYLIIDGKRTPINITGQNCRERSAEGKVFTDVKSCPHAQKVATNIETVDAILIISIQLNHYLFPRNYAIFEIHISF